jgi:hypothetical protein
MKRLPIETPPGFGVRPSSGAATGFIQVTEHFPSARPIPPGCGRDGRTPPTQKFNFGVQVESGRGLPQSKTLSRQTDGQEFSHEL